MKSLYTPMSFDQLFDNLQEIKNFLGTCEGVIENTAFYPHFEDEDGIKNFKIGSFKSCEHDVFQMEISLKFVTAQDEISNLDKKYIDVRIGFNTNFEAKIEISNYENNYKCSLGNYMEEYKCNEEYIIQTLWQRFLGDCMDSLKRLQYIHSNFENLDSNGDKKN